MRRVDEWRRLDRQYDHSLHCEHNLVQPTARPIHTVVPATARLSNRRLVLAPPTAAGSPVPLKLLLDEMFSPAIAHGLRACGHDVEAIKEHQDWAGLPDRSVVAIARR